MIGRHRPFRRAVAFVARAGLLALPVVLLAATAAFTAAAPPAPADAAPGMPPKAGTDGAAGTAGADGDPIAPRRLAIRQAIPCGDFAGELVDLAWSGGRIHLLDARELVVWSLDIGGAGRQALAVPGLRPESLFFACGDRLHVVDPWARTVSVQLGPRRWVPVPTGHRVFRGDGDHRGLVLGGPRSGGRPLARLVTCDGDTLAFGRAYHLTHRYRSLTRNANYLHVAVGDTLAVLAHRALGHLRVHHRDGRHLRDFHLAGEAPERMRRWYLGNLGRVPAGPVSAAPETLLADLAAAAAPGEFPIPIYVNDLAIHDGRIHVLVSGTVQVYDPAGRLLQSFEPPEVHEHRRVSVHEIAFTDAGELLGLDARHHGIVYRFGPLPTPDASRTPDRRSRRDGTTLSEGRR